jgi:diaminopimelate decarboxylase
MNHNLGACGHLGGMAHRHYRMRLASRDLDEENESYRIVGPLCTAIDTLARNIKLPLVKENDLLVVSCGGSYGPSSSPLFFISHNFPREVVYIPERSAFEDVSWLPQYNGSPGYQSEKSQLLSDRIS